MKKQLEKQYLRPKEVEMIYGLHHKTLANMRSQKIGPPYVKIGHCVFYRPEDIEEWIEKNAIKVKTKTK